MKSKKLILLATVLVLPFQVASAAQNYTAVKSTERGVDIVRLTDSASEVVVSIAPSVGNRLYEMKVRGKNVLGGPLSDTGDFRKAIESGGGIPFLAPWANRLDEEDFWANGKKYTFNMTLGNVRGPLPIHGLVANSPSWEVIEVKADKHSAHITSRLQFWKFPDLVAQWPFAQEYELTYELSKGVLETRLVVTNLSAEPMPISLGFHPCFRIQDVNRDEWTVSLPARKIVVTDNRVLATGEIKPLDLPNPLLLKGHFMDTGLTDFERDTDGRAHFSIESNGKKVELLLGPKYAATEFYIARSREPVDSPASINRQTACIEPMAGVTNAINLNHEGKYPDLQILAPGAKWTESFWIRSSGM